MPTPPKGVQQAAARAVRWIEEGRAGSGFTDVGRHRAHQLARGEDVGAEDLRKMHAYFARHVVDRAAPGFRGNTAGFPSPGRVAWDAWGGDAGRRWADRLAG